MAFSMTCPNRGCGKINQPFLIESTNKIFCSECKQEIENISPIAKNQIKASKQSKSNESFGVKCELCKNSSKPIIKDKQAFCGFCNNKLKNISPYFISMMLEQAKSKL